MQLETLEEYFEKHPPNFHNRMFQTHPHFLKKMLWEYKGGASLRFLGRKYKKHHASIKHQVLKDKIIPKIPPREQTKLVDRKKKQIKPSYPATFHEPSKYSHVTDRTINYGKSYKEILKEQQDRHKSKLDVMVGL